ncbi:MAG: TraR/DksA C4-type zinc finger protein [Thermomicrobia bacterium]|nr:TraR/DksA C4-type zinc finger protein [Thermomicrobia bacterium]MCA1724987.1 TraR/DksA C4-type zinc finger protein [Thermomicrobia bacterium]
MAAFTPEFLEAQKRELIEERDRLQSELRAIDQELIRLGQSQSDEGAGVGNHMADEGSDAQEQETDMTVRVNIEEMLGEVQHALTKFESGTYGICEDTNEPIAVARLEALPYARYTVQAQEKREVLGTYRPLPAVR